MVKHHRVWTDEDIERLRAHISRRGSLARATVMFGRTEHALRERATTLGMRFPTVQQLRRRAAGLDGLPHQRDKSIGNFVSLGVLSKRRRN
jgi:adenylosuccinate lyase